MPVHLQQYEQQHVVIGALPRQLLPARIEWLVDAVVLVAFATPEPRQVDPGHSRRIDRLVTGPEEALEVLSYGVHELVVA